MRTIRYTNQFKRDYKREKSGKARRYTEWLDRNVNDLVALLAADATMPHRYRDHPLGGDWKDFRDCHLKPDLILIYRKSGTDVLELVRLGSHRELGL